MATEEAVISVFGAFLAHSEGKHHLETGKDVSADTFLKIPAVAKALFRNEPGCAVKYKAIEVKIKVLQPHLKVTVSGPSLMAFFHGLRKYRNKWAVAFANYESHVVMTYLHGQKSENLSLNLIERRAANTEDARLVLRARLDAAENQLSNVKGSREFARYVRILEECTKKHKIHLQRKAHAEKTRATLAKKKKAQVKKAKKDALADTTPPQPQGPAQCGFNPDLPDFAQFTKAYTTDTPATPIGTTNKHLQQVTCDGAKAPKAVNSTALATEKQHHSNKGGGKAPAVAAAARVGDFSANVGAGRSTLPPNAHKLAAAGSNNTLAMTAAGPALQDSTTMPSTNTNQVTTTPPEMLDTSDLELEKVLRMELGMGMPDYLHAMDQVSSTLPQVTEQATWPPKQSNGIDIAGENEYGDDALGAFRETTFPPFEPSASLSSDAAEQLPLQANLFGAADFTMDHELINGQFGGGLPWHEPL